FDHSLVWELARRQGIEPEQLQGIPSNVIVRSLGPEPLVQVDIEGPHRIKAGGIYVLCSDGLSGPVSDGAVRAVVSALSQTAACGFLVDLANLQGGADNITVVVIRVKDGASSDVRSPKTKHRKWDFDMPAFLPWPWASLVLGILLALGAIGVTYARIGGGTV